MTRVVIVTADRVGVAMSGPAIRALELGRAISRTNEVRANEVRVVSTADVGVSPDGMDLCQAATAAALRAHQRWSDVLIVQGLVLRAHPWLRRVGTILVVDLYDPFHFEHLELDTTQPVRLRRHEAAFVTTAINEQLRRADFFICASEKQRDLWLGHMAGLGRINPLTYHQDPTLRHLIDVVPFGLPAEDPVAVRPILRDVVPGIGADDKIILWGGGLYPWFDPALVVRAVAGLLEELPVRLVLPGGAHPNPNAPPMGTLEQVTALANDLGLLGRGVFVLDKWVPYHERAGLFLEADVGVTTHRDHLETRFSFRTRVLDYIWTSLPVVATAGDVMAELVAKEGLGAIIQPGDEAGLKAALMLALTDDTWRQTTKANLARLRPSLTWEAAAEPLARFVASPKPAADLPRTRRSRPRSDAGALGPPAIVRHDIDAARRAVQQGGWRGLFDKVARRMRFGVRTRP